MTGDSIAINVVSASDPMHSAWVGGSMLASLPSFRDMLMTAQEYDEYGPALIDRKCFQGSEDTKNIYINTTNLRCSQKYVSNLLVV